MATHGAILLISDRPDCGRRLAQAVNELHECQTIGLFEQSTAPAFVTMVVTDVGLRHPPDVKRLHHLLSQPRALAAPIIAILRANSHLERVQASAVGATSFIPANASVRDIIEFLTPFIRSTIPHPMESLRLTPSQNIEQARLQFGTLFGDAARGDPISRKRVEVATESIMTAIAEAGIQHWLEVVWGYDDATYQHCLLVTGLAAEFAVSLKFSRNDQQRVTKGALLHDLGKAKIPRAILNKPTALTSEETTIMRSHARLGYELLRGQDDYSPEVLEVVLRHHELLDGSGYPEGLAGDQISDLVRLVTICDVYAALIERRSYRERIEPAQAFKTLREMDGKLEGALVQAFAQVAERSSSQASPEQLGLLQSQRIGPQGSRSIHY
jgi:putative nucleotidyltransferase with HDIG domain